MGLDSFWVKPGSRERLHLFFDPDLNLCGGGFSSHGDGSFRGKVYDEAIKDLTGHTLYQEVIPAATIREIADKLIEVSPAWGAERYWMATTEFVDLQRMFAAYAEAGADLVGWW